MLAVGLAGRRAGRRRPGRRRTRPGRRRAARSGSARTPTAGRRCRCRRRRRARARSCGRLRYSDQKSVRSLKNHSARSVAPDRLDDGLARRRRRDVLGAVGRADHQLGGVPRHVRVVPLQPGQRDAVRAPAAGRRRSRGRRRAPRVRRRRATRTISLTTSAGRSPSAWVSRTASSPSGVDAQVGVPDAGAAPPAPGSPRPASSLPASSRYSRWSENSVNHSVPPDTVHAPPPYSCTRVRAFHGAGRTSVTVPSADRRTIADRPPSAGRDSDHQTSSPSTTTSPSRAAARTTSSEVIGVGQLPWGRESHGCDVRAAVCGTRAVRLPGSGRSGRLPSDACLPAARRRAGRRSSRGALRFDGGEQEAAAREALRPPTAGPPRKKKQLGSASGSVAGGSWNLLARGAGGLARSVARPDEAEPLAPEHRRDGVGLAVLGLAIVLGAAAWSNGIGPVGVGAGRGRPLDHRLAGHGRCRSCCSSPPCGCCAASAEPRGARPAGHRLAVDDRRRCSASRRSSARHADPQRGVPGSGGLLGWAVGTPLSAGVGADRHRRPAGAARRSSGCWSPRPRRCTRSPSGCRSSPTACSAGTTTTTTTTTTRRTTSRRSAKRPPGAPEVAVGGPAQDRPDRPRGDGGRRRGDDHDRAGAHRRSARRCGRRSRTARRRRRTCRRSPSRSS